MSIGPPVQISPEDVPEFVKERAQRPNPRPFTLIVGGLSTETERNISPEGFYSRVAELRETHPALPPFPPCA